MSSYLLKSQARAMAAHAGDDGNHGFLVGTASLKGHNDVRLLRYSEEDEDISCVAAYGHTGEVVALAPCPDDASVIATTHNALPGLRTTIWRMPDLPGLGEDDGSGEGRQSSGSSTQDLIRLADIPGTAARVRAMAWAPAPVDVGPRGLSAASLVTVDDSSVRTFTLRPDGSGAALTNGADLSITDASYCGGVAWDPHHPSEVAVAADHSVMCWDTRSGEKTRAISGAVSPGGLVVRALSYNPNKPWHLATAGDDMRVKVWDLRRLSQGGSSGGSPGGAPSALVSSTALPVKVLDGHSHWVSSVAFNPYHDQLLLSGGTDGRVVLWRVASISSAPLLELGDEDVDPDTGKKAEPKLAPDAAVRSHDGDHDDSVVATAWSAHNAWVYASLSYGGRLVVAQVPSAEKYRVLL